MDRNTLFTLFPTITPVVMGIGLLGLGVYLASQGKVPEAMSAFAAGIAAIKNHHLATTPPMV